MMDQLPAWQVMLPMLIAPIIVIVRHAWWSWFLALFTSLAAAVVSWLLLVQVYDGEVIRYAIGGWEAPTGIEFYIDRANAGVALLVSGISTFVLLYAYHSIKRSVELPAMLSTFLCSSKSHLYLRTCSSRSVAIVVLWWLAFVTWFWAVSVLRSY